MKKKRFPFRCQR
jgi:Uncharacterised protein family (UPF0104).